MALRGGRNLMQSAVRMLLVCLPGACGLAVAGCDSAMISQGVNDAIKGGLKSTAADVLSVFAGAAVDSAFPE